MRRPVPLPFGQLLLSVLVLVLALVAVASVQAVQEKRINRHQRGAHQLAGQQAAQAQSQLRSHHHQYQHQQQQVAAHHGRHQSSSLSHSQAHTHAQHGLAGVAHHAAQARGHLQHHVHQHASGAHHAHSFHAGAVGNGAESEGESESAIKSDVSNWVSAPTPAPSPMPAPGPMPAPDDVSSLSSKPKSDEEPEALPQRPLAEFITLEDLPENRLDQLAGFVQFDNWFRELSPVMCTRIHTLLALLLRPVPSVYTSMSPLPFLFCRPVCVFTVGVCSTNDASRVGGKFANEHLLCCSDSSISTG